MSLRPTDPVHGFTLIEMLIALSLVVILSVIAVPSFINFIKYRRISITAEGLNAALQYARSEAIKRNTNVYVSFVSGSTWCYGINTGAICNCNTAGNCNLGVTSGTSTQGISLATTGMTSNSIYFDGAHGSASAASTVTLSLVNQTQLITLTINRMGGVRMCSTGITGYTAC